MARAREKGEQKSIASERVRLLFAQARDFAAASDLESASRRVRQARDICLRCNVRTPKEYRLCFCRRCLTYFTGATLQCRLNSQHRRVELKCLKCGHVTVQPYVDEKKAGKRG